MEFQQFIDNNSDYVRNLRKRNINVKINKDLNLAIIKTYNNQKYENTEWIKYCRGAVIDLSTNKLICIPPMKSIVNENINEIIENYDNNNIYQPLIDGTMINMFYFNEEWIISTRSNIGGNNSWEGKMKFCDMFKEINGTDWFEKLDENNCYSFVVQHTKNRIVTPIEKNTIHLVESYNTSGESPIKENELPIIDGITNIFNLDKEFLSTYNDELYFSIKGLTIKTQNKRIKWINPEFNKVLGLKMNYNDKFSNYIELCKRKLVNSYLKYYPEDIILFNGYKKDINNIISKLHQQYINIYIHKKMNIKDASYALIPIIRELHGEYLKTQIKNNYKVVSNYIYNLNYKRLLFIKNKL